MRVSKCSPPAPWPPTPLPSSPIEEVSHYVYDTELCDMLVVVLCWITMTTQEQRSVYPGDTFQQHGRSGFVL